MSQSLTFDGSQNRVSVPISNSLLSGSSGATVSIWIKEGYNSLSAGPFAIAGSGVPAFIILSDGGAASSPGDLRGYFFQNDSHYIETSNPMLTDNLWHHFVVASDGTNVWDWVDGIRDLGGQNNTAGTINIGGPLVTTWLDAYTNILMGSYFQDSGFFPCSMTDIRVYNRVLNDAEVDILYRAPTVDYLIGAYTY